MSSRDLHDEAAGWCARLAHDRSKASWSIRFTHADIESSPATQLAWKAHCAVKERLGRETPPQILWTKAEALLRSGWGRPQDKPPKPLPTTTAKPIPIPTKPPPTKPLPTTPTKTKKDQPSMAKKQTRRSISVSRKIFERAKTFAAAKGVSLSQLTEVALLHAIEHFYQSAGKR